MEDTSTGKRTGDEGPGGPRNEPRERIVAPDLGRSVMLLLIVLAHAPLYLTGADGGAIDASAVEGTGNALARAGTLMFVEGRAFPLFAALFGYGLVLSTRRFDDPGAARRAVRRRGRWLMAFGLGMALLITPIEILGAYGLIALLAAGLLTRSNRAITWACVVLTAVMLVAALGIGAVTAVDAGEPPPATMGYDIEGLITRLTVWLVSVVVNTTLYPVALGVLLGALAARHRILEEPGAHTTQLRWMAIGGLAIAAAGALPLVAMDLGAWTADGRWWAIALHTVTGVTGGLGYLAIFGLIGPRIGQHPSVARFAGALGRRSLTGYVTVEAGIAIILSPIFLGAGIGGGYLRAAGAATLAWVIAVLIAIALELAGRPGPLDAAMRRLVRRPTRAERSTASG